MSTGTACSTVLIIDDDEEHLQYWSNALQDCSSNYSILKASGGQAGIDLCEYQKVDCVVLDLDMPNPSGLIVLRRLVKNRKRPQIAVVVLTRSSNPDMHEIALHHGAQACLVKSRTTGQDLDKAIQRACAVVSSK